MDDECIDLLVDDPRIYQRPIVSAYLGSPLTGTTRKTQDNCRAIRKAICDELADGFTDQICVYDPSNVTPPGSLHSSREVFIIDHRRVVRSDLFIALAVEPSIGLGMEAAFAVQASVPCLLIHPQKKPPSRMLTGASGSWFEPIAFSSIYDLREKLRKVIPEILRQLCATMPRRRRCLEEMVQAGQGRSIFGRRIQFGLSREDLSRRTGIPIEEIEILETDEYYAPIFGSARLYMLASELHFHLKLQGRTVPVVVGNHANLTLSHHQQESLDNLVAVVLREEGIDDRRVLWLWHDYYEMQLSAIAGRDDVDAVVSYEEWRALCRVSEKPRDLF